MAPPANTAAKKRTRKRKRKAVQSSSSSSPTSTSSEDDEQPQTVKMPLKAPARAAQKSALNISEGSEEISSPTGSPSLSSSSPSSGSEDSDAVSAGRAKKPMAGAPPSAEQTHNTEARTQPKQARGYSLSPSPPPPDIPSFLPSKSTESPTAAEDKERILKERFRKMWMATIADEFRADLEEIRKEPNMTSSRLSMLIDSLASGAELFSPDPAEDQPDASKDSINEMELVLDG